jgi:hypothetical protein
MWHSSIHVAYPKISNPTDKIVEETHMSTLKIEIDIPELVRYGQDYKGR